VELLHELGIDFRVLAVNVVAFLVVAYVLNRFFFRPFGEFLAQRRARIEEQMTEAERARQQGQQALAEMAASREAMRQQMTQEVEEQRRLAQEDARQIMTAAQQAAQQRREQAEQLLQREMREAREQLRGETAALAADIARRALARSLGPEEREASVEAAVRQVEQLAERELN
jgi:F-type H+-transporting ATPase subunit b